MSLYYFILPSPFHQAGSAPETDGLADSGILGQKRGFGEPSLPKIFRRLGAEKAKPLTVIVNPVQTLCKRLQNIAFSVLWFDQSQSQNRWMDTQMTHKPAFATSPTNPEIKEIQTIPERKADMPYAPAIRVESPCGLLFISGATPSPLYHKHPHVLSEHDHSNSIEEQTRLAMETIKTILDHEGLTWTDIVKITKYLTDIRDQDGMVAVLKRYFGNWTPASTTVCINQLSTPGARVELDMIAALPQGR